MTYAEFKAQRNAIEAALRHTNQLAADIRAKLATILGVPERNAIGLVPDCIKFHPEYAAARQAGQQFFAELRRLNGAHAKRFSREIRADIHAARITQLTHKELA